MSRALIGRMVRRLRLEKGLAQQALAARLGISASYLNLIEHDQRAVTATLLIKLTEALQVDLAALSGVQERALETGLREGLCGPRRRVDGGRGGGGAGRAARAGGRGRARRTGLRGVLSAPLLGLDAVPEEEVSQLAGGAPNAAR